MKTLGLVLLLVSLLGLSILLILKTIGLAAFIPLATLWVISSIILLLGPDTIKEITIWKASIKRDVKAAQQTREHVEKIREEIREITKRIVEDSYILGSTGFLAAGSAPDARKRLEANLSALSCFAEPIKEKEDQWWEELKSLFSHRIPQKKTSPSSVDPITNTQNAEKP